MRLVIQRVRKAMVIIDDQPYSEIGAGLLLFLGIENKDTSADIEWLTKKMVQLRIFNDEAGIMNLSVLDVGGEVLVVSQFTLHAKTKKGNRPSYIKAANPDLAQKLYHQFILSLEAGLGKSISTGKFGAYMNVALENDGPVTILMDSKNKE